MTCRAGLRYLDQQACATTGSSAAVKLELANRDTRSRLCDSDHSATATRGPYVFSNHTKAPGRRTFGIAAPITCASLDAHPSTPPFGVVPRTRKLDCSGMEPGHLLRRIQMQSQQ
ncbi:uncharacterized protein TNCV_1126581 [Trichonephila clavipes]|nr:uncharacterized protein TNCV_1126581 [Trichonephila clavipes]